MNIKKIQQFLYSIQAKLISNEDLLKLLNYGVADPLLEPSVDKERAIQLITLEPFIGYGIDDETTTSNFISIGLPNITMVDNNTIINLDIAVFCNSDYWELNNRSLRLIEIANLVCQELNQQKFNLAGKIEIAQLKPAVLSEHKFAGYHIRLGVLDGTIDIG